ncbi:hypothetical protein TWF106_006490 [Orbilia oligospora]|uniref:Uncharacterized protein n=1 Tax=Orbilia oligospora TaxID=2813651 RepID=A0A7C8QS13_ORBOL|nr:hypothetical protein TWF106_006490 [Orbilia oligospora]
MAGASSTAWKADVAEREEKIIIPEDGKRPSVDPPGTAGYKYKPWDEVYLQRTGSTKREGPYYIGMPDKGKYPLCDENGNLVKNGEMFEEQELILYNPF